VRGRGRRPIDLWRGIAVAGSRTKWRNGGEEGKGREEKKKGRKQAS
jgi:hypothetical protein